MTGTVQRIGCDGHTQFVIIDGRYARWPCTHHQCPDATRSKRAGERAYHVHDLQTGERWTEYEAKEAA